MSYQPYFVDEDWYDQPRWVLGPTTTPTPRLDMTDEELLTALDDLDDVVADKGADDARS
jgi:hypothetical protein